MGNRSSSHHEPGLDRGNIGVEEFLLLHNAVQHHLVDPMVTSKKIQPTSALQRSLFVKFFGLTFDSAFADDFFEFVAAIDGQPKGSNFVTFKGFVSAVGQLCTGQLEKRVAAIFLLFSRGAPKVDHAGAERLVSTLMTMYSLLDHLEAEGVEGEESLSVIKATQPAMLKHIVKSLFVDDAEVLRVETFQAWVPANGVCFGDILTTFFHKKFLETPETEHEMPRDLLRRPQLSAPTHLLMPADVLALSLVSHRMQRNWKLMYSSHVDGLSFNRLHFAIGGYEGPLLFVLRSDDGQTFGAYSGTGVTESEGPQGNYLTYLFALRPGFQIFRPRVNCNKNYVFFNTRGHDIAHGLGFGGDVSSPGPHNRLWINADLEDCHVGAFGECYEQGKIAERKENTKSSIVIAAIEVWGLGGESAGAAQKRFRSDNARMFNDMKTLKESTKVAFAADTFNQEMFMSKTFHHRDTAAGGSLDK